jgi:hypothetical protein
MMKKPVLPEKEIQGLYNQKRAYEEFWLLKARIELAKFQKTTLEEVMKQ